MHFNVYVLMGECRVRVWNENQVSEYLEQEVGSVKYKGSEMRSTYCPELQTFLLNTSLNSYRISTNRKLENQKCRFYTVFSVDAVYLHIKFRSLRYMLFFFFFFFLQFIHSLSHSSIVTIYAIFVFYFKAFFFVF